MRFRSASLRGVAAVLAVLAAFCVAASGAAAAPLAFVAQRDSNYVSVIDTATNLAVGGPIEDAGEGPTSVAITPNGQFAYVTDVFGETVSVIETGLRLKVKEIEVGNEPFGIAITPDGRYAYVTDMGSNEVSVIDTRTNAVVASIETGATPTGIAIAPDGGLAYVAESGTDTVETINTATRTVVGNPIAVGEEPQGIEFTPNGKTAYVVDKKGKEVSAIATASGEVTAIKLHAETPRGIAVTPDGSKAFVVSVGAGSKIVSVINTATNRLSDEIEVGLEPQEVAIAPDGKTVYVTERTPPQMQRIDVESGAVLGPPIGLPGEFPTGLAITPDKSPVAAFTPPSAVATVAGIFGGESSGDEDGQVVRWEWSFGEGGFASGATVQHTYAKAGVYDAKLTVTDDEGCSEAMVFTGRTAYCSGGASAVTHPVTVTAPPLVCSARFHVNRLQHNLRNGTVRMQVKLPTAGFLLLFGKKVHAITRKVKKQGSTWLTVHARVELNKRLKKVHRARVRTRITFTPNAGCGYLTLHRSFALLRAKRHHH